MIAIAEGRRGRISVRVDRSMHCRPSSAKRSGRSGQDAIRLVEVLSLRDFDLVGLRDFERCPSEQDGRWSTDSVSDTQGTHTGPRDD